MRIERSANEKMDLELIRSEQFHGVNCDFYKGDGTFWVTRRQIGEALGYDDPKMSIRLIHSRHKERLDKFSKVLQTETNSGGVQSVPPFTSLETSNKRNKLPKTSLGGKQNMVIYNERGVMEICRWSRQPRANEFMDWVWDLVQAYRQGSLKKFDSRRQTAITPVEKFLDGVYDILATIREENRVFQDTLLETNKALVDELRRSTPTTGTGKIDETELSFSKTKVRDLSTNTFDELGLIAWKSSVYAKIDEILTYSNDFAKRAEVLRFIYTKMTNVYSIVWYEENKKYRQNNGIEARRIGSLDVCYENRTLKDIFESILDGMIIHVKKKEPDHKRLTTWDDYRQKIRDYCEKTGNRSIGGTSIFAAIYRTMDVNWDDYKEGKKKRTELIRENPELFQEFCRAADDYFAKKGW